jgi:NAD(P)-dependent dehydrogenase (short-subunit alcohol dehydrogenase family)
MGFRNKIALVTGASRGIGRAVAIGFAEAGASVAIHYHQNHDAAEETLAAMPGDVHSLFSADQGDPDDVQTLVEGVISTYGRIDILVNNAGIFLEHKLATVSNDEWLSAWNKTLAVNLMGPANITYWVARQMIHQGGGQIVNVSSRGAFRGEPDGPAYGASKAGLNAMSQSLAKALAPHKIFVYVVAPGWVKTDMASDTMSGPAGDEVRAQSPLNRIATPDEVAKTILFLASEGTEFLTGCIVDINGASYLRS